MIGEVMINELMPGAQYHYRPFLWYSAVSL
jgi:hypothetical protein